MLYNPILEPINTYVTIREHHFNQPTLTEHPHSQEKCLQFVSVYNTQPPFTAQICGESVDNTR